MRTKHLFYTMALAGIFAACTNDEFLENGAPQASVEGQERPTISNVTLNIGEGNADTRASWNGGFKFEKGDVISALLMDENNTGVRYGVTTNTDEWNKLTWLEKYHLVDYVHTNFPFEYDGSTFSSNCNMLEGNYFLTYPYVCLDGNRQGRIDIANQVQFGNTAESRVQALEKNQRFVGYAQLQAGEGVSDFKAELVPILAPVRIAIKSETNMGKLEVTKLVISHSKLTGTLMIDPTRANYSDPMINEKGGWNLWQDYVKNHTDEPMTSNEGDIWHFNYANYLKNQPATANVAAWEDELYYNGRYGSLNDYDYVYNVKGEAGSADEIRMNRKPNTYYWDDAIRAAVQPMTEWNNPEYATQYVELKLGEGSYDENGKPVFTQEYLTLEPSAPGDNAEGNFIEALMMLPAFQGDEEPLMLTIYTNQGIVKDIDLSKQAQGEGSDLVTEGIMDRIDPTDKKIQRVVVVLDNPNILQHPTDVVINNEDDLLQWVKWLNADTQHTGNKNPIATFTNDITIDDELASEILKLDESYVLTIKAQKNIARGNNLRIAVKDITPNEEGKSNADVLEYLDVDNGVVVEVMDGATLNFTEKSYNIAHEIAAIPGYPHWCKGQMFIEVAEGGTLNILSNDKTAIQGGNDKTKTEAANKTEVYIKNKGGYINVDGATRVLGINIVNEGEMVVAEDASVYFAPKSVNTIRGSIRVDGVISGTTNNNFRNKGIILIGSPTKEYSNGGIPEISNIINAGNDYQKMPGTIIFDNAAAKADLTSNTGIVDYQSYLNPVSFNTTGSGWTVDGVFKYTGAGKKVSELNKAYVSDADITEGQLVTDVEDAYLRNLIVRDGASVEKSATNKKLEFAAYGNEDGLLEGTILLEGGAAVNDVAFYNLNVLNALVDGTNGQQTKFTGDVAFCGHMSNSPVAEREYAGLYFKVANVLNEGTLKAGGLESVDGSKSTIDNPGTIEIPVGVTKDPQITVLKNDPKSVLNNPNPVQIQHPAGTAVITGEETLEEAFGKYNDMSLVTTIKIEGTIDMSLKENKSQAAKLFTADREVVFDGENAGLLNADALTAKALILKSDATISGPGKGNTMITVYTLDLGTSTLTASNGNIRIPIEAVAGNTCANIIFTSADQRVSVENSSSVVSENGMWYNFETKKWARR